MKTPEILAVIPARGGSKGLPGKNIRTLHGKPLIGWTIEEAKKSKHISRVVVSTEDKEIADVSRAFQVEIIDRPTELAGDSAAGSAPISHALKYLWDKENYKPDYIMLLQCTSPLRKAEHIDAAIELLLNSKLNADSIISVSKEESTPWWLKSIGDDGLIKDFLEYDKSKIFRRQDFPELFRINGAIYISKLEEYLKNENFQTKRTMPFVMDSRASVDIDNIHDFLFAEFLLNDLK